MFVVGGDTSITSPEYMVFYSSKDAPEELSKAMKILVTKTMLNMLSDKAIFDTIQNYCQKAAAEGLDSAFMSRRLSVNLLNECNKQQFFQDLEIETKHE
jgi:hypothetical protein